MSDNSISQKITVHTLVEKGWNPGYDKWCMLSPSGEEVTNIPEALKIERIMDIDYNPKKTLSKAAQGIAGNGTTDFSIRMPLPLQPDYKKEVTSDSYPTSTPMEPARETAKLSDIDHLANAQNEQAFNILERLARMSKNLCGYTNEFINEPGNAATYLDSIAETMLTTTRIQNRIQEHLYALEMTLLPK